MRNLPLPTDELADPLDTGEIFEICVSMVKNAALKKELRDTRPDIEKFAEDYDAKALKKMMLYKIKPHATVGAVTKDQLVSVYTLRMVKKNATGRMTYDRIMAAPLHRKCPYCGIGTVNTLDHFLPKTHFPAFVVTPNNLVPACEWCQGEKLEYFASVEEEQLLHPYFDYFHNEVWLAADVVETVPASFHYYAAPPKNWADPIEKRLQNHLEELKLPLLFSSNAGSRLSEIRHRLAILHHAGGAAAVKAHLLDELESIEVDNLNSWTSAMYRAAANSVWFCNGGFLST